MRNAQLPDRCSVPAEAFTDPINIDECFTVPIDSLMFLHSR